MSFMFFIKDKPLVVDAFTATVSAYEYAKIKPAINFIPNWWKTINSTYQHTNQYGITTPEGTIKRCDGLIENFKHGFIIPAWSDFSILANGTGWAYQFSDEFSTIVSHPPEQYGNNFPEYGHFKINSPWLISEKSGIKFVFTNPVWNNMQISDGLIFPQGIVEYKNQHGTNINIFLKKRTTQYDFEFGTPLAHIIPLTDKKIEIRNHIISKDEYTKLDSVHTSITFLNKYRKIVEIQRQKNKCPFNFNRNTD